MSSTIRLIEERVVPNKITCMAWCDRMDLLALANTKGEVSLHRLTWQRVWCLPPRADGVTVTALAWRPDGKLLAIGYSYGEVAFVEVENKNIIYYIDVEDPPSHLSWLEEKEKSTEYANKYKDSMADALKYLPTLPSLTTDGKHQTEDLLFLNFVQSQNNLNVFIIGTNAGVIQVTLFGIFSCVNINIAESLNKPCTILNTHLTEDLNILYIVICDCDDNITLSVVDTSLLKSHATELYAISMTYVQLYSMTVYLDNTMSTINEAWESILLEMDSKLSKYASKVPEGTVSADFLDLLMFGIPSDEMEEFLMHDLTDKGLKKLGQSIELSYSNIQKLLHKHLTKVAQSITYQLSELRGMARHTHRFGKLGFDENLITEAIKTTGAFLVKTIEVQQVINHSMTNYKAFFRWLYVVILRMMDEQVPSEIPKMAQQDLAYIVEFLQNFDSIGTGTSTGKKARFNLERLGQYLQDAPLKILPNNENNFWLEFLGENPCVSEDYDSIVVDEKVSLVQQHKALEKSIGDIFSDPRERIACTFHLKVNFAVVEVSGPEHMRMTYQNYNENITFVAFVDLEFLVDGVFMLEVDHSDEEVSIKVVYIYPHRIPGIINTSTDNGNPKFKILDVKFYSKTHLTLLLQDSNTDTAYLCQTSIEELRAHMTEARLEVYGFVLDRSVGKVNIGDLESNVIKKIDGMPVSSFCVSGSRHVCAVLSNNRRKVQLFEMEADDEEEEGDDTYMTANATRDESIADQASSSTN